MFDFRFAFFLGCHGVGSGACLQDPAGSCPAACSERQANVGTGVVRPELCGLELGGLAWFRGETQGWVGGQSGNGSSPNRQAFSPRIFLFLAGPLSSRLFLVLFCF